MIAWLILAAALPGFLNAQDVVIGPADAVRPAVSAGAFPSVWTKTAALAHYENARQEFWSAISAVGAIPPEQRTFENTIVALESARAVMAERVGTPGFLASVSPDPEVRATLSGHLLPLVEREPNAYRAVQEYAARGEKLSGADRLLLEEMQRDFRLDGKSLSAQDRDRMEKLRVRLSNLESWSGRNIWDDATTVTAGPGELAGLPADLLASFERTPDGGAIIPVNTPRYWTVMSRADDSGLRHRAAEAHSRIGSKFNGQNIDEALTLRAEQARLLGSPSYAHLAMEGRSVKSPWSIARFLSRLSRALAPVVAKEDAQLLALKKENEPGASHLEPWDVDYYTHRLLRSRGFDEDEARAYFPTEKVIPALLRRAEPLFGVKFVELAQPTWHSSVRSFAVQDADGRRVASFYLDVYQREGKTGERFVQGLVRGRRLPDGGYREPVYALVTNFKEGAAGKASLMDHEELVGLLHEFGHLMHDVLTQARYARFAGGVFGSGLELAETPSQMMEQFAWDPGFLTSLSGRDGDPSRPIPAALLQAMLDQSRVGRARVLLTWTARAAIDLALHALRPPKDVAGLIDRIFSKMGLMPPPAGHMYQASFAHLMGNYAAGYYTYLLALNSALDVYSRFAHEGLGNAAVGADYRRLFLAPGNEKDAKELARDFLGREPDPDALKRFIETL